MGPATWPGWKRVCDASWIYEEVRRTIQRLKTRLARTDRLIDRVVYRLYGLTDEEIAIVEA